MKIESVDAIYYSPTGTSEKISTAVARSLAADKPVNEIDLTFDICNRELNGSFAIIAAPVYGGRVAPTAVERIKSLKGNGSPCAVIAVYGNRDYEDALLELIDITRECGFIPVAAGAFIGEHSYSTEEYPIAQDRPDSSDILKCQEFGRALAEERWSTTSLPVVKGNRPYKEYNPSPSTPQTDRLRCVLCGRCIDMCPVGCIEMKEQEYIESDPMVCTKCCACVKGCPFGARVYETPYSKMLHENFSERKEPEWYLSGIDC